MQTKTLVAGGGAALVVALAAAIYMRPIPQQDPVVAVADPVTTADVVEPAPNESPAVVLPELSDLRFEPDGGFVVSGSAAPNLPLAVMIDGTEVERVAIGADGTFTVVGFLGFWDDPRVMTLVGDPDGAAMAGERTFVLAANPAPVNEPVATPDEGPQPDPPEAEAEAEATAAPEIAEPDVADPATPAILAITSDGVEVVQPAIASDAPPEVMSNVALDTITYDVAGDVVLRGRAVGAGFVQVYVDNIAITRLPVDADGTWRSDLPDVDTGVYTLRIDEITEQGEVVSRIETPFLREDPADVLAAMAEDVSDPEFTVATRTVQPGATLWAIAEERYGAGVLYVNVFEANRDRIRNPDLIYPGQVFTMPEANN